MTDPIKVMTIELCDPHNGDQHGYFYGLRIVEYDTDAPDEEKITNIVQRNYHHRTSTIEAIEDLLTFTQRSIRFEEQRIIEEMNDDRS